MRSNFDTPAAQAAIQQIEENQVGLIVLQKERIVFSAATPGIRAALLLHDQHPELLQNAVVIDRVIGRAAAMIFSHGGASAIYGSVMSQAAQVELLQKGVETRANHLVDAIINRRGDGLCPMEKAILGIIEPEQALSRLRQTVERLRQAEGIT